MSKLSSKHQVTIPVRILREAGQRWMLDRRLARELEWDRMCSNAPVRGFEQ